MVKTGIILAITLLAAPANACRLALVLALDVSSSVDADEDRLQRQGLAAALLAPDVQAAFFAGPDPVALSIFEWSGRYNQAGLVDWTMITSPTDLGNIAGTVAKSQRSHNEFPTAMGYALGYASGLLQQAPACLFKTIDLSGDGENNEGFSPKAAYGAFPLDDVTVNGLVINAAEFESETELVPYFRDQVIKGPNAFIEIANGFEDFAQAMERKLIRELSAIVIGQADILKRAPER
ncbi:DUF1194 domain-containing protein [Yoonia sediminilitoris]|uniref:Uncharacterized protein DUF1194 n=1 Tax=Yoonia sediminilitoris TaxID=1286148 RepID=A0A2T6KB82_9RHOB|nr:DUF1194 domain-containing protein [Yoonia sediminilitoris]PUB12110.1 uncharacterized protein DUF1194 [Yoonia sediminilitoris]RCW92937.1 uncharacterized protein DUF1194 [Yoonia sediminilitoris]